MAGLKTFCLQLHDFKRPDLAQVEPLRLVRC